MLGHLKSVLRRNPPLFDRLRAMQRRVTGRFDPTYDFLDRFSQERLGRINFIQIGANDGLRNDPVREFVIRDRWHGVFVEPIPAVFELLIRNYAYARNPDLAFVNAAVTSVSGERRSFYVFDDAFLQTQAFERRLDLLRKASFNREHLRRYGDESCARAIREIQVPCMTVAELAGRYLDGREIDLLAIDAEGHEPSIIGSLDFPALKPRVIFFESHNLGNERDHVFEMLNDNGYELRRLGPDTAAVRTNAVA